jgi:hypothetical protein
LPAQKACSGTGRRANRQTDAMKAGRTDRETDRQNGRQTDRRTDRQTDRKKNRQTERAMRWPVERGAQEDGWVQASAYQPQAPSNALGVECTIDCITEMMNLLMAVE